VSDKSVESVFTYEELMVTVDLPAAVCQEISAASAALQKATNPLQMDMFWIKPTLAHVTLLYTARVRSDLFDTIRDVVAGVCAEVEPFSVRANGLRLNEEARPNDESVVRGVWVMLEPVEPLLDLRVKLQKALSELDIDVDYLDFVPHIPIALTEKFQATREFQSVIAEWHDRSFGEVAVKALLLKKTIPNQANVEMPFSVVANVQLSH